MDSVEKVLTHYGVKGMKWGLRNDKGHEGERVKAKKLPKLDKKWERAVYSMDGAIKVHNAMADYCNSRIGALNDKHPNSHLDYPDRPETKAYIDDIIALESAAYSHAVTAVHGVNPSGSKRAVYIEDEKGARVELKPNEVKHADADEPVSLVLVFKKDKTGKIVAMNTAEKKVAHSDDFDAYLAHYGIKGMKWGVRKNDSSRNSPTEISVSQKPGRKVKTAGGKNQPASEDAKKAAAARQKAKASTTDALSNQELKSLVERMQLEANYTRLSATQKSKGRQFAEKMFKDKNARERTAADLGKAYDVATTPIQVGQAIKKTDLSTIGN
jgi:hypothetical protein